MQNNSVGLGVFLKYPEPGHVKTRLAKEIGHTEAASIYEKILSILFSQTLRALSNHFRLILFCDPFVPLSKYQERFGQNCVLQEGENLGERLGSAASSLLAKNTKALIIGSDCIEITPPLLEQAVDVLDSKDVVIGPTDDGGYYLIGFKKEDPKIFFDINWSTSTVFDETIERVKKTSRSFECLRKLRDIDTIEDLNYFSSTLRK